MSVDNKNIYRVYLEGMSATERTIFGGLIRLAEREGTHFQMESALEKTDIFILDGLDQRSLEFGRSHLNIAQEAIWIDPPPHLTPSRQIKRPLHWTTLLQLMERIVGRNREPIAEVAKPSVNEPNSEQLCELAEGVLRRYLGIAAVFIVDDVRTEIKQRGKEKIDSDVFLDLLRGQLPGKVDAVKIVDEVFAVISQARNN